MFKVQIIAPTPIVNKNRQTPDIPDSILDIEQMPSMDELLGDSSGKIKKIAPSLVSVSKSERGKNCLSDYLPIDTGNMCSMDELLDETSHPAPNVTEGSQTSATPETVQIAKPFSSIVDLHNMPEMMDLLKESTIAPLKQEYLTGRIISKNEEGIAVEIEAYGRLFIERQRISIWNSLTEGDCVGGSLKTESGTKIQFTVERIVKHHHRNKTQKGKVCTLSKETALIIDGSNVCRSYLCLQDCSSLAPVLTLILHLLSRDVSCRCVFDANERYVLRDNKKEPMGERIYENLLNQLSKSFIEAPGATNADDYILAIADRENRAIISNDRVDKTKDRHYELYPWLRHDRKRIIKGFIENNRIMISSLDLNIPLRTDLSCLFENINHVVSSG